MYDGPVSAYLREQLARDVKRFRMLVWYDAQRHYSEFVETLELDNAQVVPFRGSYYRLRYETEPAYAQFDRDSIATLPGLILYVPRAPLAPEIDVLRGPSRAGKSLEISLHALAREATHRAATP